MRSNINISNGIQKFNYVIEYYKGESEDIIGNSGDAGWKKSNVDENAIHLFGNTVEYYRHKNEWHKYTEFNNSTLIPDSVVYSKLRVYIPNYCLSIYKNGVTYMLSVNTWINGKKIDLGSYAFKPTDAFAVESGAIKYGNNEYLEAVDFYIIDPFKLAYSDDWSDFRIGVCGEISGTNNIGSLLNVTLYPVTLVGDQYVIDSEYTGGLTSFNISDSSDFLSLNLSNTGSDLQLKFEMNNEYENLFEYLLETYDIDGTADNLTAKYEIVIKDKDGAIIGPTFDYQESHNEQDEEHYDIDMVIPYNELISNENFSNFFNNWRLFVEGWCFVASLSVKDGDYEMFTIVSNELPITQEVFSRYVKNGSEKININDYMEQLRRPITVINKIENNVVKLERQTESNKSNIIQPVFFRVKDTELLTLHPTVTENICINLDDYKAKVKKFVLQINGSQFNQIGSNNYGVIFKIHANKISKDVTSGIYYILNENLELVTSGKFNCVV